MKKITNDEHKKILIDILDYFHKLCIKNNINYSLIDGSLIGAIREKGIIPWDDDIDVALDLENYRKLMIVLKKEKNKRYKLINNKINNSYYLPFDKIIDVNTNVIEYGRRPIDNYGAFIDIFCIHNLPENRVIRNIHYKKIRFWQNMIFGYSNVDLGTHHLILKKMRSMVSNYIGINYSLKKYNRLISKYDNKESKYNIFSWPDYGYKRETLLKEWFNDYLIIKFGGIESMVFARYDDILTSRFGEYMTPPPVNERQTRHNMDICLKDEINPLISCIITTYNRPVEVVKRAVDSVLNQTYKNIEVIVVNDYPENKDLSRQINELISSYKNKKMKYICLDKNSGACFARNVGANNSKGSYLAFLDDDDEWLNEKLEIQLSQFVSPDIGLVYCDNYIIKKNARKYHKQVNPNSYGDDYKQILEGNFIGGVSFPLINSKCFFEVGGFDINLPSQQDTDLWIRILKKYRAVNCNKPLLNYYISDTSITSNLTKKLDGYNYILNKYKKDYKKYNDVLSSKYITIANVFASFGDFKTSNDFYSKAKMIGISNIKILKNKIFSYIRYLKKKII